MRRSEHLRAAAWAALDTALNSAQAGYDRAVAMNDMVLLRRVAATAAGLRRHAKALQRAEGEFGRLGHKTAAKLMGVERAIRPPTEA